MQRPRAMIVGESVRQSDLALLRQTYRLIGHPTVARVPRLQQGGGFGDQEGHPFAWAVFVQVDGLARRVTSARPRPGMEQSRPPGGLAAGSGVPVLVG